MQVSNEVPAKSRHQELAGLPAHLQTHLILHDVILIAELGPAAS